jgi:SAM-dependent methyltransferase
MPTRYVPTVDAYDAWAEVYDEDGNVLQGVDDWELGSGGGMMMEEFVSLVSDPRVREVGSLKVVDLGCGTGRNTVALVKQDWPGDVKVDVTGIDASAGMLAKAAEKLQIAQTSLPTELQPHRTFHLLQHDFLNPVDATLPPTPLPNHSPCSFDALITTLVLEHFPLSTFFSVLTSLIRPGGFVLLTNMHPSMGALAQAGFVSQDSDTGEAIKVRGTSWVHGVEETADTARAAGFEVVGSGGVRERGVDEGMIERGVVGARARKWIGVKVWYGMILRKVGNEMR